jgi:hypothetical protein
MLPADRADRESPFTCCGRVSAFRIRPICSVPRASDLVGWGAIRRWRMRTAGRVKLRELALFVLDAVADVMDELA